LRLVELRSSVHVLHAVAQAFMPAHFALAEKLGSLGVGA
jgi:hypothetical protein